MLSAILLVTYEHIFICSIVLNVIDTNKNVRGKIMENNTTASMNSQMPDLEILFDLADLFKVFGDSTRIRIMFTISDNEMSVLNIAEALNMEQSTISHQLRVLRQNKLVRVRRDGKQIYYSLDDDHVKKIIEMGLDHVLE